MHEALDDLYAKRQEEFEKNNPLTYIYKIVPLNQFQNHMVVQQALNKLLNEKVRRLRKCWQEYQLVQNLSFCANSSSS